MRARWFKFSLGLCLLGLLLLPGFSDQPVQAKNSQRLHVALLTPRNDAFWTMFYTITQAAADDLKIDLEWLPALNDPQKQLKDATELLQRKHNRPDVLVYKNYNGTAIPILKMAEAAGVYSLIFEESLTPEEAKTHGRPREKYAHWLGEIVPDNIDAGFRLMEALIAKAKQTGRVDSQGRIQMIALAGNMEEGSSSERIQGLQIALQSHPEVLLHEIAAGFWKEPVAQQKTHRLLQTYPDVVAVWTANDTMPVGARRAADALGKPDLLIGGTGTTPAAAQDLQAGKVDLSVGGNFLLGGFVMVLLHDYFNGYDFASESTMMRLNLYLFNRQNVSDYARAMQSNNWQQVDFGALSKAKNHSLYTYNFGFAPILAQMRQRANR